MYSQVLKQKILNLNKIAKIKKKKTCLFISNTKKINNNNFYFTPIRETNSHVYFGIVLFDGQIAKKIAKIIDGKFDMLLVDTEKKSRLNNKKIVNIERTIKLNIKRTYIRFFKANDLTINSAEDFLSFFFKNDVRTLAGKKILIIGIGNIGFKLSLRLVERGCYVHLYKKDKKKNDNICRLINDIKPIGTLASAIPVKNLTNNLSKFDIIICAADKKNVLKISKKTKLKTKILFVDIGKGMFDSISHKILRHRNILVHRLDVTPSLNMLIATTNDFKDFERKKIYQIRKIKDYTLVSPGVLGQKNELIVDNPQNPKIIHGLCDGEGDLISLTSHEKLLILEKISKRIKKKLLFN